MAEDRDEAERMVTEDCGLVLGGNIHTTRDDDEVTDWKFGSHPDMQILSLKERDNKGKVKCTAMCFSDRIEELRKDIIEATRQLLYAHGLKELSFTNDDEDPVWVIWFDQPDGIRMGKGKRMRSGLPHSLRARCLQHRLAQPDVRGGLAAT